MSDADQIAAFLAKNPVTKIAEGSRTLTRYDLYLAVRGETPRDRTQDRHLAAVGHDGHEFWVNAEGERIT